MADDFLARLDAAIGCQHCTGPLGASPSDDFCSDACQRAWHAQHGEALVGYREPWDLPNQYEGLATGQARMRPPPNPADWRLPVQTADLAADRRAWRHARDTATTDAQRAACRLRGEQLAERSRQQLEHLRETLAPFFAGVVEGINAAFQGLSAALAGMHREISRLAASSPTPPPPPRTRAEAARRAMDARKHRNTGPPAGGRPPRRIDAPGARR